MLLNVPRVNLHIARVINKDIFVSMFTIALLKAHIVLICHRAIALTQML